MRSGLRLAVLIAIAAAITAAPAHACSACANPDVKSPMIDAARLGMGLLIGLTSFVQAGIVAFFLKIRRHARRYEAEQIDSEWSVLQRSSHPS